MKFYLTFESYFIIIFIGLGGPEILKRGDQLLQEVSYKHGLIHPRIHAAMKTYAKKTGMGLTEAIDVACKILLKKPEQETIEARRAGIEPFKNPFVRQIKRAQRMTRRVKKHRTRAGVPG